MRRLLALAGAVTLAASPAFADNTDTETVTVSGAVIASLEVAATTGTMIVPDLVLPSTVTAEGDTSVTLGCGDADANNTVSYTANGSPFADGNTGATTGVEAGSANTGVAGAVSTGTCAVLTVTGEPNYNYQISFANLTQPSTAGITLSTPTCRSDTLAGDLAAATAQPLPAGGIDTLRCGVTVTATSAGVDYTDGSFDVVATYD